MKTNNNRLYTREEAPYGTLDETQRLVIKELQEWMTKPCNTRDEKWDQLQAMDRLGRFVIDYADRKELASVLYKILNRIIQYGKPVSHKVTMTTGIELNFDKVEVDMVTSGLIDCVRSLISSALDGYKEEKVSTHKDVAKWRVNRLNRELHEKINQGEL